MLLYLFIVITVFLVLFFTLDRKKYEQTEYFKQTHNSYWSVRSDKGLYGEYCTYKYLKPLTGYKRFLFNCYLPKSNAEKTEVDVILIHESGIYVLESKNYSGWIFGTETKPYWTQTLPGERGRSKKTRFLNPIIQNKVHLKWLKEFLQEDSIAFHSYIVFSDRCTLKDIHLTSQEHHVINRYNILSDITYMAQVMGSPLTPRKIEKLYDKLFPLTQSEASEKLLHVETINKKYHSISDSSTDEICPWCGNKLILRTATKGVHAGQKFWGCSNFPKCRYSKKQ